MTNLDSIFKSRDIRFKTKLRLVKAMVFPVVMYGCVLSPEVLRATPKLSPPSCSASQSSGRAAGEKDVVRL